MHRKKTILRGLANRLLHVAARFGPGATSFRPFLHKLRGVKIHGRVFIGDEVYIENEYPERVEIGDGVEIGLRSTIVAHFRGPGRVVIEKDAYIGPNTLIAVSSGRTLTIGEGCVIAGSSFVTRNVAPRTFIRSEPPKVIANVNVALTSVSSNEEFLRGLRPVRGKQSVVPANLRNDS
jgi:acetyltransferase-like isoleucine patch superfamily enzyme